MYKVMQIFVCFYTKKGRNVNFNAIENKYIDIINRKCDLFQMRYFSVSNWLKKKNL